MIKIAIEVTTTKKKKTKRNEMRALKLFAQVFECFGRLETNNTLDLICETFVRDWREFYVKWVFFWEFWGNLENLWLRYLFRIGLGWVTTFVSGNIFSGEWLGLRFLTRWQDCILRLGLGFGDNKKQIGRFFWNQNSHQTTVNMRLARYVDKIFHI